MLWALLILLLIRTLSGGPEEIFMVPKLEKEIKSHVIDKVRKDEILALTKEAKKEIKTFSKFRKKKLKEMKKMGASRDVSSEMILAVFQTYYDARLKMQTDMIDKRLRMQQLFTEEEWDQVIEKAVFPSEKARKKADKEEGKVEDKLDKFMTEIAKVIEENIGDENKRGIVVKSLDKFKKTFASYIEEGKKMNHEDNKTAKNRNATRDELGQFYKKHNELRYKGSKEYLDLRDVAIKNTNDKEWKAISKALGSIYKN